MKTTLDADEFQRLNNWFQDHSDMLPTSISPLLGRLIHTYSKLTSNKKQQKKSLAEINKLMGLIASSEKGSSEKCSYGL